MKQLEKALNEQLRASAKERGYASKGKVFFRRTEEGNTLMLASQKSRKSTDAELILTIDSGVFSARVGRPVLGEEVVLDPSACHWRRFLTDGAGKQKWLHFAANSYVDGAKSILREAVDRVIDRLEAHATDASIRDTWLTGDETGGTALTRLIGLAILLNAIGPAELLPATLQELRDLVIGEVQESSARSKLARAGISL